MDSITHSLSTDFDIPDSASATSSTLVLTPHSGQNVSKWHVDRVFSSPGSSVVDNSTTYKPSPASKQSQPLPPTLRLLALRTNPNRDPMFQNHGKGPVQPHFNNLPRRRPGPPRNPPKAINKSSRRQERIITSSSSDSSSSKPKPRNPTLSPQSHDHSSATGVADSASVNSTRYDSSPSSSPHRPSSPSHSSQSHAAQHSQRLDHVSDHGRGPLHPIKHDHDHHQHTRSGSYGHIPGRLNQIHLNNHVKAYYYAPSSSPSIIAANRLLNQPLFDANVNFNVNNNNKESSSVTLNDEQPPSTSKGHVQPHVSNIPRRRTRGRGLARDGTLVENIEGEAGIIKEENGLQEGHTKTEIIQSPEEKKAKRRRDWEEERCFEEICRGSGIWVGFSKAVITTNGWVRLKEAKRTNFLDMDQDSEGSASEREREGRKELVSDAYVSEMEVKIEEEEEEFVEGASERVIRVCLGEGAIDEEAKDDEGSGYSEVVEQEGRVMKLYIPGPSEKLCDEGIPHLTRKQMEAVRVFLNDDESNSMESISNHAPESSSSSSSASSTLVSPTPYPERQLRRVCILVPPECAIDGVALGVLLCLGLSRSPSLSQHQPQTPPSLPSLSISQKESLQAIENLSGSRVLAFLSRLHDVDNLQLAWRGCFSCDGIEWIESLLMGKGSAEEKEGQGC